MFEKEKLFNSNFNHLERFRWICILRGCDYIDNLLGIGLNKAKKLLELVQSSDIETVWHIYFNLLIQFKFSL